MDTFSKVKIAIDENSHSVSDYGHQSYNKIISVLFILIVTLLFSSNAFSTAGDLISNTATINFDVSGVPSSVNASTSFTEDRRINFLVSEANGGAAVSVISDMTVAVLQYSVTNLGNGIHDFLVTAANTSPNPYGLPVDNFDPLAGTVQTFVESGVTPGYQVAQDTAVFIDELPMNASRTVYIIADLPTVFVADVSVISLIAQVAEGGGVGVEGLAINSDDNFHTSPMGTYSNGSTVVAAGTAITTVDTIAMDTVFNDPSGAGTEDVASDLNQDTLSNGQHSDAGVFQVISPVVINKSVTVIDTLGGTDPHPGATLRYQIVVSVIGTTNIDNLIISDVVPANTTYTDNSIDLNGVLQTDSNDTPTDFSRAIDILSKPVLSIEVDLSQGGTVSVIPGSTNTINFEVTIN